MKRTCVCGLLTVLGLFSACSEPVPAEDHTHRDVLDSAGQRILECRDGARASVAFLDAGLTMSVTWLPRGPKETLAARRTGASFQGARSRAVIAGGTVAFQRKDAPLRLCRRVVR